MIVERFEINLTTKIYLFLNWNQFFNAFIPFDNDVC